MFDNILSRSKNRRTEVLQKRYDKLLERCQVLEDENRSLNEELGACRAKLACVDNAEQEFMKQIDLTKQAREKYERAFEELQVIRSKYSAEVKDLIKSIQH